MNGVGLFYLFHFILFTYHIDSLVQERHISSALNLPRQPNDLKRVSD